MAIAIAARQIEQHGTLQIGDVLFQERETTSAGDELITRFDQTDGCRTRKIITPGSVLRKDVFEPMPAVRQNEMVMLVVRSGAVRLTAKAVAKADGVVGQTIQVQREGTHDRLYARVVSVGMVEAVSERMLR
jgi:flagella basal body P-ring formation protein FlgA